MLPTAEVVLDVVEPLLDDWPEGTVWLQMSSVGAAEADQLTQVGLGTRGSDRRCARLGEHHPAEQGQLTILASGPDSAKMVLEPAFAALASRVMWVGEAGMGSRLKLAANQWMISGRSAGRVDAPVPRDGPRSAAFHRAARRRATGVRLCGAKAPGDAPPQYPAGFPVRLALKDLELVHEVEQSSKIRMPVLDVVLARFTTASQHLPDEDLAAIYELDAPAEAT